MCVCGEKHGSSHLVRHMRSAAGPRRCSALRGPALGPGPVRPSVRSFPLLSVSKSRPIPLIFTVSHNVIRRDLQPERQKSHKPAAFPPEMSWKRARKVSELTRAEEPWQKTKRCHRAAVLLLCFPSSLNPVQEGRGGVWSPCRSSISQLCVGVCGGGSWGVCIISPETNSV